jgi:hypothetical protein
LIYTNGDKFRSVVVSISCFTVIFIVIFLFFYLSGHWLEDKASGMGRLDYANGDYYEGQWELDRRHGWGKFFSNSTGHTYEGYWKNGLKVIFSTLPTI